ncbi:MAG: hypothetical protein AVDCRST_MAG28-505, partial [uncultured Rubrobacteraceae bacterium]
GQAHDTGSRRRAEAGEGHARVPRTRRLPGRERRGRTEGAGALPRSAAGPGRARPDAAGAGRAGGLPALAAGLGCPDHHADRPRRRGRRACGA